MIVIEETVAVLLCAGLSQRFGPGNKLLEPLDGKPLAQHAADLLRAMPFAHRIAVTGSDDLGDLLQGFETVPNPHPEQGQDSSVRIGIEAALSRNAAAVLICLADMPGITREHFASLMDDANAHAAVMSSNGDHRSPPVLIPAALCREILAQADQPVRAVLAAGNLVEVIASPDILRDFDTPADFRRGEA